jgi:hypothetical protein
MIWSLKNVQCDRLVCYLDLLDEFATSSRSTKMMDASLHSILAGDPAEHGILIKFYFVERRHEMNNRTGPPLICLRRE